MVNGSMSQVFDKMPVRHILLLYLSLLYSHCLFSSTATDTITPSRPLKDGQILTSSDPNNNFALGFFTPGNTTRRRYVGVWYNNVPEQTVIWVANRDHPIYGSDGILSIADDGNLVLSSQNVTVWSTQIKQYSRGSSPKAVLLGSGNIVLTMTAGGGQNAAWQSFDYPTHVFMPEMLISLNRRTGFSRYIRSWRSNDDPGSGRYTFRVGADGELYVYRDGWVPVWRAGPYVGDKLSGIPEMTSSYLFNDNYTDSPDEIYFTYTLWNTSMASMFIINGESGNLERRTWLDNSHEWNKFWAVPGAVCDQYAHCGVFGLCNPEADLFVCSCFTGYEPKSPKNWYLRDGSEGCVRKTNVSMCKNGEGFLQLRNVKLPETTRATTNMSLSVDECRQECLRNCSCSAFNTVTEAQSPGGEHGCRHYYGKLVDTRIYGAGSGQDLFFRVDATDLAKNIEASKNHIGKNDLAAIVVCITLVFTLSICYATWFYKKKRKDNIEQQQMLLWLEDAEGSNSSREPVFHQTVIVSATRNFDPANFLGQGGFGPVFKGKLASGQEIAVKRLSKDSRQGIDEFKNEVRLISKLQHKNLVKTLGYCVKGDDKMLVYEFLPNKSLDNYIFNNEKKKILDWRKRHEIIIGIARGVLYLHQDSTLKIIHRDLKVGNVLLDEKLTPKISDFGLARIFGNDQSEANTRRVVGTYGYMSPEYAMEGLFSIKSDVFSFGVMLLEIISGKRTSGHFSGHITTNLIGYVWKLWLEGKAIEVADESIATDACDFEDEVVRCIHIGILCVQENPNERPSMLEVISMLSHNSDLPSPKEPAFILRPSQYGNGDPLSPDNYPHSVNGLSITLVGGR